MANASAQPAPTAEVRSIPHVNAFICRWAPLHARPEFIRDLGAVISAVGADIVRAAMQPELRK